MSKRVRGHMPEKFTTKFCGVEVSIGTCPYNYKQSTLKLMIDMPTSHPAGKIPGSTFVNVNFIEIYFLRILFLVLHLLDPLISLLSVSSPRWTKNAEKCLDGRTGVLVYMYHCASDMTKV